MCGLNDDALDGVAHQRTGRDGPTAGGAFSQEFGPGQLLAQDSNHESLHLVRIDANRPAPVGAPDGVSAVFLHPLLAELGVSAPGINISVRQLLPTQGETSPERAWRSAFADLDARAMDIAIIPSHDIPARFHQQTLDGEDIVVAMRAGHPFGDKPTLDRYCEMQHLVVSLTGDPYGFVDEVLSKQGLSRRIALTVFLFALAVIAETDLISALPRRFVAPHAPRFGVVELEAPLPLARFQINAVAPKVAMMDMGLTWLSDVLGRAEPTAAKRYKRSPPQKRRS
jgi:DNA-binding transcriptional LysR family regulator